uniref:Tenascin XB n=1 Tax=Neolamprologus brichardi TaxID=32507 RepID=A0A3Q4HU64_NEOBR
TKPKRNVSGFKVTYTHAEDGESLDSYRASFLIGQDGRKVKMGGHDGRLFWEVMILFVTIITFMCHSVPDPPTHLRAVNVTDSTALLLWRPALAAVDKYSIVKVTVSGNAAEQQLSGLEGSTTYTVTVTSQLGSRESSPATTSFTTTVGEGPQDLQASNVTPRTATLSWKPPSKPQLNTWGTPRCVNTELPCRYNLTRLHPGSTYTLQLRAEGGGQYTSAISTEFTTGTLRYPFPTDCSQELLNGIVTSGEAEIFPQGRHGTSPLAYCNVQTGGGKAPKSMPLPALLASLETSCHAIVSGDSLSYHNNRIFSTKDRDLAPFITRCALSYRGGWWYKNCHEANLNGVYGINTKHQGVIWTAWKGKDFSVPFTEMKLRPAAFRPPSRG